jgi:hypothetical protein
MFTEKGEVKSMDKDIFDQVRDLLVDIGEDKVTEKDDGDFSKALLAITRFSSSLDIIKERYGDPVVLFNMISDDAALYVSDGFITLLTTYLSGVLNIDEDDTLSLSDVYDQMTVISAYIAAVCISEGMRLQKELQ